MNVPFLFVIFALVTFGARVLSKVCSNLVSQNTVAKYSFFLVLNSIVACIFFTFLNKFKIALNVTTFWYSVIFALVCSISTLSLLMVYRYTSVSGVNIITNAGAMLCTAVVGWVLFSEDVGFRSVFRIVLMLVAAYFTFIDKREDGGAKEEGNARKKSRLVPFIISILLVSLSTCATTVILKYFSASDSVTDQNSFFFFTNVVMLAGAIVVFAVACLRDKGEFKSAIVLLHPKKVLSLAGNTVCNNITSVVSALIIAQMEVSLYSPISSALGIIVGLVGSLVFREKLGLFSYLSAAIAGVAIFI